MMADTDAAEDGWCGGYEVHTEEGRLTQVLGPDGEPVRFKMRHQLGFDLRPRPKSRKVLQDIAERDRAALTRLAKR